MKTISQALVGMFATSLADLAVVSEVQSERRSVPMAIKSVELEMCGG